MPSRAVQIACITLFAFCSKCINSAHADSFTDALAQQGRVYLHNNQAYAGSMAAISARLASGFSR